MRNVAEPTRKLWYYDKLLSNHRRQFRGKKRTKNWSVGDQSNENGVLLFISATLHTSSSKQIITDMISVYTLTGLGVSSNLIGSLTPGNWAWFTPQGVNNAWSKQNRIVGLNSRNIIRRLWMVFIECRWYNGSLFIRNVLFMWTNLGKHFVVCLIIRL